jgi:hypothetical protein
VFLDVVADGRGFEDLRIPRGIVLVPHLGQLLFAGRKLLEPVEILGMFGPELLQRLDHVTVKQKELVPIARGTARLIRRHEKLVIAAQVR